MEQNLIFFSIIIPTYNRADFISKTIASVLDQTYPHFEIIIVDDGSTDNTEEVIKSISHPKLRYFKKQNGERGAARNYGVQRSKGSYINFFDSDDFLYPHHFETAAKFIKEHKAVFFNVGYEILNEDGKLIATYCDFPVNWREELIKSNYLACNSVFLTQELALQFPFIEDRKLTTAEDWEIWLRISSWHALQSCNTITFAMVEHAERSLNTVSPDRIIERDNFLLQVLLQDDAFKETYKNYLPIFIADRYTFFSLILALTKKRRIETLKYISKAFIAEPKVLKRKRFWASLKHLL